MPVNQNSQQTLREQIEFLQAENRRLTAQLAHCQQERERLQHSEARLQAIFDSGPQAFVLIDPEYRVQAFNKIAHERVKTRFGRNRQIGESILDYIRPDQQDTFKKMINKVLQGEAVWSEHRVKWEQGQDEWFEFFYTPVMGSDNQIIGVCMATISIDRRKRAEEALREGERRYRRLFDTAQEGILIADDALDYIDVNPAACALLGYSREEFLRLSIYDLTPAAYHSRLGENWGRFLAAGQFSSELGMVRKDGALVIVENRAVANFAPGQHLSIVRDITARKAAEQALRESEEKYRLLAENIADVVWVVDENFNYTYVSPSITRLAGYTPEEFMTLAAEDFLTPASARLAQAILSERVTAEAQGRGYDKIRYWQLEFICKNGATIWVETSSQLLRDETGAFRGLTGAMRDVTEQKYAQQAYQNLVEHSVQGVVIYQDYRIVYANQTFVDTLGYSLDELRNMPTAAANALAHPDDQERMMAYARRRLTGEPAPERFECRLIRKDGQIRTVDIRAALTEYRGKPASQLTYVDVTDRKQAELAQKAALEHMQTLYSASLSLGATVDLEQVLDLILTELQKVVPYDSATVQVFEENCFKIVGGRGLPDLSQFLGQTFDVDVFWWERQIVDTRRPVILENLMAQPEAVVFPGQNFKAWMGIPLLFGERVIGKLSIDKNEPGFFAQAHADLAMAFAAQAAVALENARLFEEAEQAKKAAERASQAKSRFLASMSHELRTPLNGVLGYAQILEQDTGLSAEQREAIRTIRRSGEHLLTVINDILDISRIEAGQTALHRSQFNLPRLVQTIIDIIRLKAQKKGLTFFHEPLSSLPLVVSGDEHRLRQVLLNLLDNAVKFTVEGQITLSIKPEGKRVHFRVEDTGIGIPENHLSQIFQPFAQIEQFQSYTEGTGLGLAISRHLVELMGGGLNVTSVVGRGSVFWFEIDLPPADNLVMETEEPEAARVVGYLASEGQPLKILVVDDHLENRAVLQSILAAVGFAVLEAKDGHEALALAERWRPDLIMLDLVMPHMDGFEVLSQLKRQPLLAQKPVLAISANVFADTRQKCMAAGCRDFLAKPFRLTDLFDKLQQNLALSWLYEHDLTAAAKAADLTVLPSSEALEMLYDLISIGDLRGFREKLVHLKNQDAALTPFADTLDQLAKDYRLDVIDQRLQQWMRQTHG